MRCRACQAESPSWSDFCLRCGRTFSIEERTAGERAGETCEDCGAEVTAGSRHCLDCGAVRGGGMATPDAYRVSLVAKLLALIPGIFNFFGLGHLYLGKYRKAFAFLLLSIGLRLANDMWVAPGDIANADIVWLGASLMVFIYQLWDIYRITDRELLRR